MIEKFKDICNKFGERVVTKEGYREYAVYCLAAILGRLVQSCYSTVNQMIIRSKINKGKKISKIRKNYDGINILLLSFTLIYDYIQLKKASNYIK